MDWTWICWKQQEQSSKLEKTSNNIQTSPKSIITTPWWIQWSNQGNWGPRLLSPTFVDPSFKFVINFNSLNIHSVFKITPYIHKIKEAPNLSATNGRCMKPKLEGSYSMVTLFNGTIVGNTIELLIVLQYH